MGWRDGCEPWPVVAERAERVTFDFGAADEVGRRLDALRREVDANLDARAGASARLVDWAGPRRVEFDDHRAGQEAVVASDGLGTQLGHLRAAWDEAARAQRTANRAAAELPPGVV